MILSLSDTTMPKQFPNSFLVFTLFLLLLYGYNSTYAQQADTVNNPENWHVYGWFTGVEQLFSGFTRHIRIKTVLIILISSYHEFNSLSFPKKRQG
jgi:hypothetical protein